MRSSVSSAAVDGAAELAVVSKIAALELVRDRHAEQQVLGDRQVAVVALGVERLDQAGMPVLQAAMQARRGPSGSSRRGRGASGSIRAAQAERVDVLVELDLLQHAARCGRDRAGPLAPASS